MAITTATTLTAAQTAMVAEARFTFEHVALMTNLVTRKVLPKGAKSIYIPKFSTVSAADLTDGVDMTASQTLAVSGTTHTTDEAGCKVILTKKLLAQMSEDMFSVAGKLIGNAMGKKIDTDLLALFDGLSGSLGTSNTNITLGHIAAAHAQLIGGSEPVPPPFSLVLHPYQINDLVDLFGTAASNAMTSYVIPEGIATDVIKTYFRGCDRLYGTPIFADGNLTIDGSGDCKGALFSKLAFIYLVGWEPEVEREYDASLRAFEIVITADYGAVEEDDAYGKEMYFDAETPAS
jgi:hypothetical protein